MKLASEARALITLGPQMSRAKLMQAALRMRQLAKKQTLLALTSPEVSRHIWKSCDLAQGATIEAKHVLQWVHQNLVLENSKVRLYYLGLLKLHCISCILHRVFKPV